MSVNSNVPILILKEAIDRKEKKDGLFRFAAAIDGSDTSIKSIDYIWACRGPKDHVEVIICGQPNVITEKVKEQVTLKF